MSTETCTCLSLYVFSLFLLFRHNLHNDLSTHLWVPANRSTQKWIYLFSLMLLLWLRRKTYLSPQLLVYLPFYVPVHDPSCSFSYFHSNLPVNVSTVLHVHRLTCSSIYLFSLFLLFLHILRSDLSTHLLGYLPTDPPENKFTCLPSCFSFV